VLSYAFVSLLFCPGYVLVSFCNLRFVCFSSPLNKWQSSCPFSKKKKFVHDAIQVSHEFLEQSVGVANAAKEVPPMSPDICIVNFYGSSGKLGLHQV
jgi:hypothetical protein